MPTLRTDDATPAPNQVRRALLLGAGASLIGAPALAARPPIAEVRRIAMVHARTGERFDSEYFAYGAYMAEPMAWVDWVMRDVNVDRSAIMSNPLVDVMARIQALLDGRELIITSGYRCAATQAQLAARSRRAARKSLHVEGRAVDFYVDGVSPRRLAEAAVQAGAGGVGLYRSSGFIHVDVGPRRTWFR